MNTINQSTYTSDEGVYTYIDTTLQSPEISIFVKYKDYFYNKNILDIGCGAGRTSYYFRNFTNQYIGIDYSKSMIDYCKAEYPELSFQHSDARDLSAFKDNSFDFVMFSYNGIDYISDADRIKVFMEIKRILKKNGVLVFSTHNLNFKKIELRPSLEASLNPINFIRNFINYIKQVKNNYKNKKEQTLNNDYSILNDSGNGFSLLTYYITREKQIEQLNKINLKLLEIFDMNGQTLKSNIDDSNNAWLYYVVQKC